MTFKIHPENPQGRKSRQVAEILSNGGVMIYPTDSVYALGCDIDDKQAIERLCKLRGLDPVKANLTIICGDISQITDYTMPIDNNVFRFIKRNTPGPVTFILRASSRVPKKFQNKKREIGVRIPDHGVVQDIISHLGRPIITASLKKEDDDILEYYLDMESIEKEFSHQVDVIVDGGTVKNEPSTVVDCTGEEPLIEREGAVSLKA